MRFKNEILATAFCLKYNLPYYDLLFSFNEKKKTYYFTRCVYLTGAIKIKK